VWNNLLLEVAPDGNGGGASIIWQWSMWDHLVQDFDASRANYGDVRMSTGKFDINFCPPLGKPGQRDRDLITGQSGQPNPSGLTRYANMDGSAGTTGEKDWLHCNSATYCAARQLIVVSLNVPSEVILISRAMDTATARTSAGDIVCRLGNPATQRRGGAPEQSLFCQHSVHLLENNRLLLFNNGRFPDRAWSTVDEFDLAPLEAEADALGPAPPPPQFGAQRPVWSYGPRIGRRGSFYCTHIGACQRLDNGNTLVTMGPQGIVFEVTPQGVEVWRYVSPLCSTHDAVSSVRQGDQRSHGRFSLFHALRYSSTFGAFEGRELTPGRYLEA
jgi:hypothetical protein